jgi:tRNA/tmRNA/rRNA uracil-C5-methylase (TrmA/RlmC/RlmD family)
MSGIAPAPLAALTALCADAELPAPVVVDGTAGGHRHRARLAVRGRATSPKIGIFQEDSHRIADIPRCVVHHPLINAVADAVKAAIRRTGTAPYADAPHRGALRYLQVVVERTSGRAQVVLVGNDVAPAPLEPLATELARLLGPSLHSLWWNGHPERTNAILGPHWHRWSGPDAVRETIGGADVFFPPGAFGQSNLPLADALVAQVHAWVPDGTTVAELHAGCGAIGLGLLPRIAALRCNEIASDSLAGLAMGLAASPFRERARVLAGPASEHLDAIDGADVVVVDPPRKGLDAALLARLVSQPPPRLVVVSCGLDAFLREAAALRTTIALRALVPFALFPFTEHVETVALFEAAPSDTSRRT